MNIVYLGSGEFGVPCLDALKASGHTLALVVTQPANPAGRGRKPQPTPAAQWAAAHDVPFAETDNVNSPQMLARIADCRPDVLVVIAFGQKIGPELVKLASKGAINVHASLLPKYRGAAPINWAILRGETHTGNSIITLAEKIDAGDILAQSRTAIGPLETAGELHDRLAQTGRAAAARHARQDRGRHGGIHQTGPGPGHIRPKTSQGRRPAGFRRARRIAGPQGPGLLALAGGLCRFCLSADAKDDARRDCPGRGRASTGTSQLAPGMLDEDLNVICGQGRLRIIQLKPAGSALMDFKAFINGWQSAPATGSSRSRNDARWTETCHAWVAAASELADVTTAIGKAFGLAAPPGCFDRLTKID